LPDAVDGFGRQGVAGRLDPLESGDLGVPLERTAERLQGGQRCVDYFGPEIVDATLAALEALGSPFQWDTQVAGLEGVKSAGDPLPPKTIDSIRQTRLALKGPLETPSAGGYRSSNVRLREEFKLYANLRPARTLVPGGRFDNIDLVVVRENLEGLYIGHEHYIQIDDDPHAVAMATGVNTRQGSRRLLDFAFYTDTLRYDAFETWFTQPTLI